MVLTACSAGTPDRPQSTDQPLIGAASPSPSSNASGSNATDTAQPGTEGFDEEFSGVTLDAAQWQSFAQSGVISVHDGLLDLVTSANVPNYPYVVTKADIIPQDGAFFFETKYNRLSFGAVPSISLDYLPASAPNVAPLTQPFMALGTHDSNLTLIFNLENGTKTYDIPNSATLNVAHRIRVENDGQGNYRVIVDETQIATFHSAYRPMKFWIGANPPKDRTPGDWSRMTLDYVKAGLLTAPDPATPAPSKS